MRIASRNLPTQRNTAKTEVENYPDFHRGQVRPSITVSHLPDQDMAD
jgi:hypothetical protein